MWHCKKCETDNSDMDDLCTSCDWEAPRIAVFVPSLKHDTDAATYAVHWELAHCDKVSISHGVGVTSATGDAIVTITNTTELVFTCTNEYCERIHTRKLPMPLPVVETFIANDTVINIGRPVELTWKVKYADLVSLSSYGNVTGLTSTNITLDRSGPIILTAENSEGVTEKTIEVILPPPEIIDFSAGKNKVIAGDDVLLQWTVSNTEEVLVEYSGTKEVVSSTSKMVRIENNDPVTLHAVNSSGTVSRDISFEVFPKPIIKYLDVDKGVVLENEEVELAWETQYVSKILLHIDAEVKDVTTQTRFKLVLDRSKMIKFVCESEAGLKSISRELFLKVVEKARINLFETDAYYTIQSKPVVFTWSVSNATDIYLWPDGIKLEAAGIISVIPTTRTFYTLEARNELTSDVRRMEINVMPLPTITSATIPPIPDFKLGFHPDDEKMPAKKKGFREWLCNIFRRKRQKLYPILRTSMISIRQSSGGISITRKTSLRQITRLLRTGLRPGNFKSHKKRTSK
jgi:hypothetical protein